MKHIKTYGPFTPQEFKNATDWLEKNNTEFTHFKDEKAEKRFAENSPENLVNQVELRTRTYLGAVFFIQAEMSPQHETVFRKMMGLTEDSIPEKFKMVQIPEEIFPEANRNKKVIWSRILLFAVIIFAILKWFKK